MRADGSDFYILPWRKLFDCCNWVQAGRRRGCWRRKCVVGQLLGMIGRIHPLPLLDERSVNHPKAWRERAMTSCNLMRKQKTVINPCTMLSRELVVNRDVTRDSQLTLSLPRVLSSKLRKKYWISFCKFDANKQYHMKVLLNSFHLNGHTLRFHPQTQKLEPHLLTQG